MINWELLTPRNIAVIGFCAVLAVFLFQRFSPKSGDAE